MNPENLKAFAQIIEHLAWPVTVLIIAVIISKEKSDEEKSNAAWIKSHFKKVKEEEKK